MFHALQQLVRLMADWRYTLAVHRAAEELTEAALASNPKDLDSIEALDGRVFRAILAVTVAHDTQRHEAILTKYYSIDTWE